MKAQILKIAGVKNETEFYRKYPTEEAFMKKHGKELQKAKPGAWIPGVGFDTDVQGISKVIKKNNQDTGLGMLANSAGSIVGLSQSIADKYGRKDKQLDQYAQIAKLAGKAASTAPQPPKQKYVRPEDQMFQPINPLGVQGFGYLENGGEIQNTFAPNDIYTDMGYEPLNDSNPKQYADGGIMASLKNPANSSQFMSAAGSLGGGLGSLGAGNDFQQTEEGSLLSTIGGAAGTVFGGPIGGIIGSAAGGLLGGIVGGNKAQEQKRKMQNFKNQVASIGGTANIQNMIQGSAAVRNGGHIASYENGGYMNPEYNPQVIAKFGDYTMDQLLAPPHDADMLRAGGHLKEYTPPSASAMYTGRDLPYQMEYGGQMAMGGDLQVHRGEAETMSYNPFLPDGGETIMFRGPSHDNGGMPISYGENGVEVEGGEPAIKLQDGGSPDGNLVVYGNMVIPDYGAAEIGDEKAKGKKFKHYIADLSKVEAKQNKLIDKTTQLIDNADANDQFDKLSLNTGQANMIGTTMKLKDIAEKKKTAATVQNAILDTAKEHGLESDALAKGKIKYAKANDPYAEFGANLEQFGKGGKKGKTTTPNMRDLGNLSKLYELANKTKHPIEIGNFQKAAIDALGEDQIKKITGAKNTKGFVDGNFGPMTSKVAKAITQNIRQTVTPTTEVDPNAVYQLPSEATPKEYAPNIPEWMPAESRNYLSLEKKKEAPVAKKEGKSYWDDAARFATSIAPFIVPSNQMDLEAAQLAPEIAALSDNTLEPVYAQTYQPQYTQPVSISYQDQMNANQADFNALQRQFGYNPEMINALAANKYKANSQVLGEQFRANQAEQQRARETNRETANDAQMKNMAIYQDQAQKMAQTKSVLKQQKNVALSSIADKIAKNKLENRQLGIAENMYKYRYTPNGVAYNVNGLANFAPYGSGSTGKGVKGQLAPGKAYSYDDNDNIIGVHSVGKDENARNGKKISRNGSIVKAIKNL